MLQIGVSLQFKFSGNLKAEWAVFPPCNNVDAMPEEALAIVIFLLLLTFAKSKFIKNVFPVPPGASKKNTFPAL